MGEAKVGENLAPILKNGRVCYMRLRGKHARQRGQVQRLQGNQVVGQRTSVCREISKGQVI